MKGMRYAECSYVQYVSKDNYFITLSEINKASMIQLSMNKMLNSNEKNKKRGKRKTMEVELSQCSQIWRVDVRDRELMVCFRADETRNCFQK